MPPPPLPPTINSLPSSRPSSLNDLPSRTLPLSELSSPTASFANLSLLSPLVTGPTPHFPGSFPRAPPKVVSGSPLASYVQSGPRDNSGPSDHASLSPKEEESVLGTPFLRKDESTLPPDHNITSSLALSRADERSISPSPSRPVVNGLVSDTNQHLTSADDSTSEPTVGKSPEDLIPESGDLAVDGSVAQSGAVPSHEGSDEASTKAIDNATPPPPPPPKVKLSLKDFALRKKRQREAAASPLIPSAQLVESHEGLANGVEVNESKEAPSHPSPPSTPTPLASDTAINHVRSEEASSSSPVDLDVLHTIKREPDPDMTKRSEDEESQAIEHLTTTLNLKGVDEQKMEVDSHDADQGLALAAKIEITESNSVPEVVQEPTLDIQLPGPLYSRPTKENAEPVISPRLRNEHPQQMLNRQISQEDGEIFSPPAPKPLPLAPRAHTPPTHPRSFHSHSGSTSAFNSPCAFSCCSSTMLT